MMCKRKEGDFVKNACPIVSGASNSSQTRPHLALNTFNGMRNVRFNHFDKVETVRIFKFS